MCVVFLFTPDAAVSAISATVTLDGKLDSDVGDEETVSVKLLVLGVGLGVLEDVEDVLAALLGPSTLSSLLYMFKEKKTMRFRNVGMSDECVLRRTA